MTPTYNAGGNSIEMTMKNKDNKSIYVQVIANHEKKNENFISQVKTPRRT